MHGGLFVCDDDGNKCCFISHVPAEQLHFDKLLCVADREEPVQVVGAIAVMLDLHRHLLTYCGVNFNKNIAIIACFSCFINNS